MPSGLANKEKQRVRQLYAEGKVGRDQLLEAEADAAAAKEEDEEVAVAEEEEILSNHFLVEADEAEVGEEVQFQAMI